MTDEDAARWYDEHRDDLLEWVEDPPAERPAPRRRRGAMVSARFSQEEVVALREAAAARGMSLSALVRDAALSIASGAPPVGVPPTAEEIRQIVRAELADQARAGEGRRTGSPARTDTSIIEWRSRTA